MATFNDRQQEHGSLQGMKRALMHAIDMNNNGRLEAKELDEFRRYLIGKSLDAMSMDDHITSRNDGNFDRLRQEAGQGLDDPEERDPMEMGKSRDGIAQKIVADYLGNLWNAGKINDDEYIAQMKQHGLADIGDADEASPEEMAPNIYAARNGMAGPEAEAPPEGDDMGVDPEFLADFAKRHKPSPNTPSGRRR